jgi:ATP/ADP translocase
VPSRIVGDHVDVPIVPTALTRLARSIGVERNEVRVFAWAAATFFLIHAASVVLANASDTLFLKRIGVNLLPVAFLVSSLLLVLTTSAMVRLAARGAPIVLLVRTFFGLSIGLVLLWLLALADVRGVFAALVVISKQVESIAQLVFWVAIGGMLHARQAKRLYAPIVAGGTLGEILGSFASGIIGKSFSIAALLPFAAAMLALAGLLARRGSTLGAVRLARARPRTTAPGASALGLLVPLWRESHLFRILAVSALLCGALGPLLYFQFSYVADRATQGSNAEIRLLTLYANFRGWLNVAVLALQLLGTARLFRRIGVPLAATISPLIYLLGFFSLSFRLRLEAAVGAMAGATLQDHAVYDPAQRILVTLFPERQRPAATTLVEGPIQRTGGVLGNLLLLATIAVATPAAVGFVGLPIALVWLGATLLLWRIYPTLLLEVATARRLLADEELPLSELVDPSTQRVLAASLLDADPVRVRAACALMSEGPAGPAVLELSRAAGTAPLQTRPLLVETLHRVLDRDGDASVAAEAAHYLEPLLADPTLATASERANLVEAYARLAPDVSAGSHAAAVLAQLLNDPDEAVRLAAMARLHRGGTIVAPSGDFDAVLAAATASDDAAVRHVALDELRALLLPAAANPGGNGDGGRWSARLSILAGRLGDERDRTRAAEILADLAAHAGTPQSPQAALLLPLTRDSDPGVRAAVLRFVGQARIIEQIAWTAERLASDDDAEADAAATALRAFGPTAIQALLDTLHSGRRAARQTVLSILRDLQVAAPTLRSHINRETAAMQRTRLQLYALTGSGLSDLALQRLRERIDERAHAALLLLAALLDEDRLAVLGRLLARSPRGRNRAVLVEAIEALLPPDERERLIPLLDDLDARTARDAAQALGRPLPTFAEGWHDALAEADALTAAFFAASRRRDLAARRDLSDTAGRNAAAADDDMLKRVEIVLHLRSLDLFASLTTRQLSEIAVVVREEVFQPGTAIVREGEFGDCMYLIVSGEVLISREGQFSVTAKAGELFGEMSLFDGETRFATVSAVHRVRLLRLDRQDLFELMEEQPSIAIGICQTLSRHARDSIMRLEQRVARQK